MSSYKTLRTYNSLIEAEGARSFLEAHGIKANLPDRHALYHQPHLLEILGGVRLQVSEEQFQEAEELLIPVEKRSHLTPLEPDDLPVDQFGRPQDLHSQRRQTSVKWLARFIVLFILLYWAFQFLMRTDLSQ